MSGTNTRSAMLNWLVCDGELAKIMPNHLWLDFNLVESFPVVYTNHAPDHFWKNDHTPQVCLNDLWFL